MLQKGSSMRSQSSPWVALLLAVLALMSVRPGAGAATRPALAMDFETDPGSDEPGQTGGAVPSETWRWSDREPWSGLRCLEVKGAARKSRSPAWTSPWFPVRERQRYRITFAVKTRKAMLWAAQFHDRQGHLLEGDHNSGIEPCSQWTRQEYYFVTKYPAVAGSIVFFPASRDRASVDDLRVEPADVAEERAWVGQVAAAMPPMAWRPPVDAGRQLPRTLARLRDGGPLRIVLLGDSIANDLSNSPLDVLLEGRYRKASVELRFTGRGGTGWLALQDDVASRVLVHKPDLVILLAISNEPETMASPLSRIVREIRQGAPQAELLLITPHVYLTWGKDPLASGRRQRDRILECAARDQVDVVDLYRAWTAYLKSNGQPPAWLQRDGLHMNERGRLLAAEIVASYLGAAQAPHPLLYLVGDRAPEKPEADTQPQGGGILHGE